MLNIAKLQYVDIGRGFRAYGLRGIDPALIDPFLGVDHAWISAPTFPPHPHAGFSAISYLFPDSETDIQNRDSLGNRNLVPPGSLHWTTAGRGVMHEEFPAKLGKTVHMLQIFANLPRNEQNCAPSTLNLSAREIPSVQMPGIMIRIPLGSLGEVRSPLAPPTDVALFDISLEATVEFRMPVPAGQTAFVLPIAGLVEVDGKTFDAISSVPIFTPRSTAHDIRLAGVSAHAQAMVFSGTPLRQPVHWQGPLAMASAEALAGTIAAYQRGEFGQLPRLD